MCLSFPARVVEVEEFIVFVDYGGGRIEPVISNGFELSKGDYVMVSYGMIMEKINEEEYNKTMSYSQEIAEALKQATMNHD